MILVLGANGQVGSALSAQLGGRVIRCTREQVDMADPLLLMRKLERFNPSAVINASAYTAVDRAESERQLAYAVNGVSPGIVAQYCKARAIPFIHYSTDYVFDGGGIKPWSEEDSVHPLNMYGASKLAGEQAIEAVGGQYFIFRTSWVYDAFGRNFFNTMLRLAHEKEELRVVAVQFGAPTYAPHLAKATLKVLACKGPYGIYHLCNSGVTSWHGFAEGIFAAAREKGDALTVKRVLPIATHDYPTPAARPLNSRLDCHKAKEQLGLALAPWQEGLKDCMEEKYGCD